MPPRKRKDPSNSNPQQVSLRWPNLFANVPAARSLVEHPHFPAFLADLRLLRLACEKDVIFNTTTMESTNFFRGQIAVCVRAEGVESELTEWEQSHR